MALYQRDKTELRKTLHRLNLLICLSVIVIIAGYTFSTHLFGLWVDFNGNRSVQHLSYKVGSGDTLWKIASHAVNPNEDVRDKIIAIQKLNQITASQTLVPGQTIQIPLVKITTEDYKYTFNFR